MYPSPRAITLHDLLTYRLGIGWGKSNLRQSLFAMTAAPIADALLIADAEHLAPDDWMARLGEFPLLNEPGAYWRHQLASDILGVLIARITGKTLETALREHLFEPLGMGDTSFAVPAEKRHRLATLYAQAPSGGLFSGIIKRPRSGLSHRFSHLELQASFLRLTITSGSGECC